MLEIFALVACYTFTSEQTTSCKILNPAFTIYSTREACEAAKKLYPIPPEARSVMKYSCWKKNVNAWERVDG